MTFHEAVGDATDSCACPVSNNSTSPYNCSSSEGCFPSVFYSLACLRRQRGEEFDMAFLGSSTVGVDRTFRHNAS